ncbi:glycosyltransferase family 25 protein [Rhodobacter sp. CZR27]|uniref:glycosyltransferase family 25 protein n=1 Tax=Rhodobacter sp. CZR27 TaxID=2033869 RepID=UPI0012FDB5CC|nr:glycosyltransferase family 25 protein [Rhodobacter sp. CZR27]
MTNIDITKKCADAGSLLTDALGNMVLISLVSRSDRRVEFLEQLLKIGLSYDDPRVTIFDAIRPKTPDGFPTIGARGCFLSHLEVLRRSLESGANSVLICEDDLNFTADLPSRINHLADQLAKQSWDMLYGFSPPGQGRPVDQSGELLEITPDQEILCAHMLAFRRSAIEKVVPYLQMMLTRPPGDPEGGPMHVDGAYNWFRKSHPELRVLAASPPVGFQRASATDIHALGWKDKLPGLRNLMRVQRRMRNRLSSA